LLENVERGWSDEGERKRAEEAQKEADRRKDEFLATLAHGLRNPLAPHPQRLAYLPALARSGGP
jgi:signal transduction histidine kinase